MPWNWDLMGSEKDRGLIYFSRRRTRQSGPLGELFDHGVDAVNTSLEVLLFAASQNFGMGWKTVMILFACRYPTYEHFAYANDYN
jgi:hypothetical protein